MIYFGTKDRMIWAKPPAVNTPLSKTGISNTGVDLNGGGYSKLSPTASRDYTFTWGASPAKDIYDILDYRTGAYGNGLLYYLDPFAMKCNVLNESFSFPKMLCDIFKMGGTNSQPTGSRAIRDNLFQNPSSARLTALTGFNRVNHVWNPAPVGSTGWTTQGANSPVATNETSGGPIDNGGFRRMQITQTQSSWRRHLLAHNQQTVEPGKSYTFSIYFRSSKASDAGFIGIQWFDTSGSLIRENSRGDKKVPAGEWVRLSQTATAPETASYVSLFMGLTTGHVASPGDTLDAANALFELGNRVYPWFDGTTPPVGMVGAASSWGGTANASKSTAVIGVTELFRNLAKNPTFEYGTAQVDVARNEFIDPEAHAVSKFGGFPGGTGTTWNRNSVAASWSRSGRAVQADITAAPVSSAPGDMGPMINDAPVDQKYTLVYRIKYARDTYFTLGLGGSYGNSQNFGQSHPGGQSIFAKANVPVTVWVTFAKGSTAASDARVRARPNDIFAGDKWEISEVELYPGDYQPGRKWFSGTYSYDSAMLTAWTGTPNASASRLIGVRPTGIGPSGTYTSVYKSAEFALDGLVSLCVDGTQTTGKPEAVVGEQSSAYTTTLEAGKTYTAAAYIRLAGAGTDVLNSQRCINFYWSNNAGATYNETKSVKAPNSAGVTKIVFTFSVPSDANRAILRLGGNGFGERAWWDMFTLVEGNYPHLEPFHGDYSFDQDFYTAWTGVVGNSESFIGTPSVQGTSSGSSRTRAFQAHSWSMYGGQSTRITPLEVYVNSSSTDTFSSPGGDAGGMRNGMVAGMTYTVSGVIHLDQPQTGQLNGQARAIAVYYRNPVTMNYLSFRSESAPNVAGDHEVSFTFTLPSNTPEAFIRFYNGAAYGGGDVWWDNLMLTSGSDKFPYFDGSFPNSDGLIYGWVGSSHASASTISVPISNPNYTALNQPIAVAVSGASSAKHYVPVPSGYSLWVSYVATANILQANGTAIPATDPTNTTFQWAKFTNSQELQWVGSGTVWGAQAVVLRNGESPDPNHQWTPGKGNSGLRFSAEPQVNGLSAVIGGHAGMVNATATFKETGLWE